MLGWKVKCSLSYDGSWEFEERPALLDEEYKTLGVVFEENESFYVYAEDSTRIEEAKTVLRDMALTRIQDRIDEKNIEITELEKRRLELEKTVATA